MLGFSSQITSFISTDVVTNLFKCEDFTKEKHAGIQSTETGISSHSFFDLSVKHSYFFAEGILQVWLPVVSRLDENKAFARA